MRQVITYLKRHRILALVLAAGYFVAVTLGHDVAQDAAYWMQDRLNRHRWNAANRYAALLAAIVLAAWCARAVRRCVQPWPAVIIGVITTACAVIAFNTLFVMNVEAIHFPQYALLALLVYPLIGRYGETVLLVTLLGALDEGYQYLVLHRNWGIYFDLNDVTLNLLGAGFGVVLIYFAMGGRANPSASGAYAFRRRLVSPVMMMFGVVVVLGAAGAATGRITVLPADDSWLVLRRCGPPGPFWVETDWGARYHVLLPVEALLLWTPLLAMYFVLDQAKPHRNAVCREPAQRS